MAKGKRRVLDYKNFDPQIWKMAEKVVDAIYQKWLFEIRDDRPAGTGPFSYITPKGYKIPMQEVIYRKIRRLLNKCYRDNNGWPASQIRITFQL